MRRLMTYYTVTYSVPELSFIKIEKNFLFERRNKKVYDDEITVNELGKTVAIRFAAPANMGVNTAKTIGRNKLREKRYMYK
jgi:hypothetical protein